MTSPLTKILRDSQSVIVLFTALVFFCSNQRWPLAVAVFLGLQLLLTLLALLRQDRDHASKPMRFHGRAAAAPPEMLVHAPAPPLRRAHLHLVP